MITKDSYLPVIACPERLGGRWLNKYKYPVSSCDGLPIDARAAAIQEVTKRLVEASPDATLCVEVDTPGKWYIDALKSALRKDSLPIAIMPLGREPTLLDFAVPPITSHYKPPQPTFAMKYYDENRCGRRERSLLRVARGLARMSTARTWEIASVSGISHTHVLQRLAELGERGYVQPTTAGKYPAWELTKDGISWVQKFWNVPPDMRFASRRQEQRYAGQRHRYVSRMGRSRITAAYRSVYDVWEYWTEFFLDPVYPDALAWGELAGVETLTLIEVDAGHMSRQQISIAAHRWDCRPGCGSDSPSHLRLH